MILLKRQKIIITSKFFTPILHISFMNYVMINNEKKADIYLINAIALADVYSSYDLRIG